MLELGSHIPEILAYLHPEADPADLLARVSEAALAGNGHRLCSTVQVPLTTANISTIPETVAYLADLGVAEVRIVPYSPGARDRRRLDARAAFSKEYLAWTRNCCLDAADARGVRVAWPFSSPPEARQIASQEYGELVQSACRLVVEHLPSEATVLVASKGDDAFLALDGRTAWHFPRGETGGFAYFNPPDGGWAVRHLEDLARLGAGYLVVPATAFWWFDHYAELTN